jgi:hypothetical protein
MPSSASDGPDGPDGPDGGNRAPGRLGAAEVGAAPGLGVTIADALLPAVRTHPAVTVHVVLKLLADLDTRVHAIGHHGLPALA